MNYGKDYNLFFLNKIDNFVREPFDERLKEGSPISDLIFSNRLLISSSPDIFDFIHVLESFYRGIVTRRLMEE